MGKAGLLATDRHGQTRTGFGVRMGVLKPWSFFKGHQRLEKRLGASFTPMAPDDLSLNDWDAPLHPNKLLHRDLTELIIGAAYEVHNVLGFGFLEKIYQRALQAELLKSGLRAEIETPINVIYKGVTVGEYFADVLVEHKVLVELKVAPAYNRLDEAQLINELKATGLRVGLLINFGRIKVEFKRLVF